MAIVPYGGGNPYWNTMQTMAPVLYHGFREEGPGLARRFIYAGGAMLWGWAMGEAKRIAKNPREVRRIAGRLYREAKRYLNSRKRGGGPPRLPRGSLRMGPIRGASNNSSARRRRGFKRRSRNYRSGGYLGKEHKFLDTQLQPETITTVWTCHDPTTVNNVHPITNSGGTNGHDGRQYHITAIHFKGSINIAQGQNEALGDTPDTQVIRLALVLDKQTNGAQLTPTDVYGSVGPEPTMYFRNLEHVSRFQVLWTKRFRLHDIDFEKDVSTGTTTWSWGEYKKPLSFNIKFRTPLVVHVTSTNTDGNVSRIRDNSVHLIGCADDSASPLEPWIHGTFRVRFYE